MADFLDPFIPRPEVRERHEITIHAPAALVLEVARRFDMQSIPIVRALFWLRAKVLGAGTVPARRSSEFITEMLSMGWVRLAEEPGRCFVAGAACQPWKGDVVFSPIAPEQFADFSEPEQVKIAWTLEAEAQGPALTRFATETRAVATDAQARKKFLRYWRSFKIGIVTIRLLLLPAIRREAERQWRLRD
jgi:hypothetical protein